MSGDVLAVYQAARRDPRLNRPARRVLCQVARQGRVGDLKVLAGQCAVTRPALDRILDTLSSAGHLPEPTTRGTRHDARTTA